MPKLLKSIRFGLTPWLFNRLRKEAQRQNVSMSALVRTAVARHLGELVWKRVEATGTEKPPWPKAVHPPFVFRNEAERQYAEMVLQQHFDEDR